MAKCKTCQKKLRPDNSTQYCSRCYKKSSEYKEKQKQYRLANKEKIKAKDENYYDHNKEKILKRQKLYNSVNKEKLSKQKKQYYKNNKEKIKQYQLNNKEEIAERKKQRYMENKEEKKICIICGKELNKNNKSNYCKICFQKTNEYKKQKKYYRLEHRDYFDEYNKQYRKIHKEKLSQKQKQYYKKNKELFIQRNNKNEKKRRECDVNFRIKKNVSRSINYQIKKTNTVKKKSTCKYADINEIIIHLENQFDENMNWKNYGTYWHIDHIIPQSLFDFTNEEQIKLCWRKENLRPLKASENISKSNLLNMKLVIEHELFDVLKMVKSI